MEGEWWSSLRDRRDNLALGVGVNHCKGAGECSVGGGGAGWIIRMGAGGGCSDGKESPRGCRSIRPHCCVYGCSLDLSIFLIWLPFANCCSPHAAVIHRCLRHVIPLQRPHLILLLSSASWNATGPENGKWIPNLNANSHPLLSLPPSVSRLGLLILALLPSVLLFLHSPCTHGKFWWDSEQIVHPWKQATV